MALTRTTVSAVAVADTEVTLASVTGLNVGDSIKVDGEYMKAQTNTNPVRVVRGTNGTNATTHPASATATFGGGPDWTGVVGTMVPRRRDVISISANGAIPNPTPGLDRVVVINGTTALNTLTLGNPTKDNDGDMLILVSNGKGAHIVTYTTIGIGGGGATTDVVTFSTVAQMSVAFIAMNELWVLFGASSGAGAVAAGTVIT